MGKEIEKGAKVHYNPGYGKKENGIVKSVNDNTAFVVYHCGEDWAHYENYTGASTNLKDLEYGWVDESGNLKKEYCEHHYLPDGGKWSPINQRKCIYCGDVLF